MSFKLINTNKNENIKIEVNGECYCLPFTSKKSLQKELLKYKRDNNINIFSFCAQFYLNYLPSIILEEHIKPNRSITLNTLCDKYGKEEGTKKWDEYIIKQTKSHTLEGYINKYGKKKGTFLYNERSRKHKENSKGCLEYWINKGYSEEESIKEIKKQRDKGKTLEWFTNEYGHEEGNIKYLIYKSSHSKKTKENSKGSYLFWINKGYSEEEAKEKVLEHVGKNIVSYGKASKESLTILEPLYNRLIKNGIIENDIFWGNNGKSEYFIRSNNNFFRYDFTIKSKKIIIEYNGIHVHPTKEFLTEEEWNKWKHPFDGRNAEEKYNYDRIKIKEAEKKGFKVFEIWSCESLSEINKKIAYIENTFIKE